MRKRMYAIPAACILFILYFTVFGERGLLRIYHLSREREQIQERFGEIKAENDKFKREIEALKTDRRYLESIARKDFGLVRPNEMVYQFPSAEKPVAEQKQQKPAPTAAEKKR
ncbi:FtsB family cell division protein [Geobacter pickeringii]|uniref:Septum formation initiator n=1 Tax=Geobacter pickeringii TaxID=345632 RepID=A0A0B5B8P4_9BACT|nr:septum formation initiator family protein [Geobacter pickeringii]AJE03073.1 septum formation initiator [Geobacter pickeringii]